MTDRITYVKKEERVIVDTHLLAMATCIWPGCTHYKAQDFQLCADHIRSAAIFHQQQTPRPNIPMEVKQRIRAKQEEDLALYTAGKPLKHSTGSVYVLRSDDMIKIGYSETPRVRLKHYSPGAQVLVVFPGNLLIEKHIHHEFRHLIVKGREWFKEADELAAWIQQKQEDHGTVAHALNSGRFRDGRHIKEPVEKRPLKVRRVDNEGAELRRILGKYNR